ncbi:MAG: patatin-like phospholipase family protein [Eubacteriales bacterium]
MSRIGLVLSGGMMKGAYQAGVLKALLEYIKEDEFHMVSGASIGAVNGYAAMCGNLDCTQNMWLQTTIESTYSFVGDLLRHNFVHPYLEEMVGHDKLKCRNFIIPVFNFTSKKLEYVNLTNQSQEDRLRYMQASVALPGYNDAIRIQNQSYYDGAMIDNIPILPLQEEGLDYIICVYFDRSNYFFETKELDDKIIRINFNEENGLRSSMMVSSENVGRMYQEGYERTKHICSTLFQQGTDDVSFILEQNKKMQEHMESKKIRISGDVIVNNLNKVLKKLVARKLV